MLQDDSGVISLSELAGMIRESSPGSLVECDLLAIAQCSQDPDGDGSANRASTRKKNFVFDDYLWITRSLDKSNKSVTGAARKALGIT